MGKTIVFVTYTMLQPIVGGAFIRCVRLATEMARRGWRPVICNSGPFFADPKIDAARGTVRFVQLDKSRPGFCAKTAAEEFQAMEPALMVMGESPFQEMDVFYEAARRQKCPFVVLDQYYNDWLIPSCSRVDLILLYGLASFWPDLRLSRPYELTPPFIEEVAPRQELPVPPQVQDIPWITTVAYDHHVLQKSLDLLCRLAASDVAIVSMSRNPAVAKICALRGGLNADRFVALPLQDDRTMFGFFAASAVSLVSNGFLQVMDCLALASPVIAIDRGSVDGQSGINIADQFQPYVSFEDPPEIQLERMRAWLRETPFSAELKLRLAAERHGVSYCANRLEALYRTRTRRFGAWLRRSSIRAAVSIGGTLGRLRDHANP